MNCNCHSNKSFQECCEPYISGKKFAPTAEALMRSRYTAYTLKKIDYIQKTLAQESQGDFSLKDAKEWAENTEWLGLEILNVTKGGEEDSTGVVEFTAKFKEKGKTLEHHEVSQFKKDKTGHWVFVDGDAHTHEEGHGHHHHHEPRQPVVREAPKVGRNDPCPCGSGKKFKKCHGSV